MAATGYIRIHAYTSFARLPLKDVAVTVTAPDGTAIATRLTDRSGLTDPIEIPAPDTSAGTSPDSDTVPYTAVNVYARLEGFEQVQNENVQIFPNVVTEQDIEMVPHSELPESWSKIQVFLTPTQNL
jgi:hypothetical protein